MIQTVQRHCSLVLYKDGERRYILAPKGLKAGDPSVQSGVDAAIKAGNALPMRNIQLVLLFIT